MTDDERRSSDPEPQPSLGEEARREAARAEFHPGGRLLSLFATDARALILRSAAAAAQERVDGHDDLLEASRASFDGHISGLIGVAAAPERASGGLTPFGRDLLRVGESLDAWLGRAPGGPLGIEGEAAKAAIRALASGWDSTALHAFAAGSLAPGRLGEALSSQSDPVLERRVRAMVDVGLLSGASDGGDRFRYGPTEWLREAAAPLFAAIRCEHRHLRRETAPLTRGDVEALLLLAIPLLGRLEREDGSCQLAVDLQDGSRSGPVCVDISIEDGGIASFVSKLDEEASDRAVGSAAAWLEAVVGGDPSTLQVGAPDGLSAALVEGLHERLYATPSG